jgi:hypothetical protein
LQGEISGGQLSEKMILFFPGVEAPKQRSSYVYPKQFLDFLTAPGDITLQVGGKGLTGTQPGTYYPDGFWFDLDCEPSPAPAAPGKKS